MTKCKNCKADADGYKAMGSMKKKIREYIDYQVKNYRSDFMIETEINDSLLANVTVFELDIEEDSELEEYCYQYASERLNKDNK